MTAIRISTHAVHHEANRFFELGTEGYMSRVLTRVKDPAKKAASLLWLAYLAQARENRTIFDAVMPRAREVQRTLPDDAAIVLVWSRKHKCFWADDSLDRWLDRQLNSGKV